MEDSTAARGERAQGANGILSAGWDNPRGGGRAGGRLKLGIKLTIGEIDGGDVVSFEDMREFLVAYSEYKQQINFTNQDGEDQVLLGRRGLVHSSTQLMVTDEVYESKRWVDLTGEELMQGLKRFAGNDMQQANDEDFLARYSAC